MDSPYKGVGRKISREGQRNKKKNNKKRPKNSTIKPLLGEGQWEERPKK